FYYAFSYNILVTLNYHIYVLLHNFNARLVVERCYCPLLLFVIGFAILSSTGRFPPMTRPATSAKICKSTRTKNVMMSAVVIEALENKTAMMPNNALNA